MYQHILLPHDGSALSEEAAQHCIEFARSIGARVTLIHIVTHRGVVLEEGIASGLVQRLEAEYDELARKGAGELLAKVQERARANGVECGVEVVVGDSPYREIIGAAGRLGCDLIMMASHGRRGLEGLLLGSETVKVLTHCAIPVLVVRHR